MTNTHTGSDSVTFAPLGDGPGQHPHERGSALIGVLLLLMMMSALAAAMGVNSQTETAISRNHRSATQAQAAAEAGLNHAVAIVLADLEQWEANGFADLSGAVNGLFQGPDGDSGTEATDADNFSLEQMAGWGVAPGTRIALEGATGVEYEVVIMDDDDALTEDGLPLNDLNATLIVRATGYATDNTKVVLEALINTTGLPAIVSNGDINVRGGAEIIGSTGGLHANGDLTIDEDATVIGTLTATGTFDGNGEHAGTSGAPPLTISEIHASDYRNRADFILTSAGEMTDLAGTVLCDATGGGSSCNEWTFKKGEWKISKDIPPAGTYYVEGDVVINNTGKDAQAQLSVIAEGSIDISGGNTDIVTDDPDILFVTDGDLKVGNGDFAGDARVLVREQLKLTGGTWNASFSIENAAEDHDLVKSYEDKLSGNVSITWNGGTFGGSPRVNGFRDVRDAD